MASLTDIAPLTKEVPVRGVAVSVPGVSAAGVASLIARYPEFRRLLMGGQVAITPERLTTLAPEIVASIISAGLGKPGHGETERIASDLTLGEQLDLIEAIIEVTMPGGIGPFMKRVEKLQGVLAPDTTAGGTKAADSNSPQPSKS